jgi:hypothetical protein
MPRRPSWFQDGQVIISNAPTCGVNKNGDTQFVVDHTTGIRSTNRIDNKLADDIEFLLHRRPSEDNYLSEVPLRDIQIRRIAVPQYYNYEYDASFDGFISELGENFKACTIAECIDKGWLKRIRGHGSPSSDQRVGLVPYIKVSDLRAGAVNINPSNRVPLQLAQRYWNAPVSNLKAYDLISPERASKNIGEFCILMPGQEQIVLTKEVIVLRAEEDNEKHKQFDQFYLMWALTLQPVREQWRRITLMQTNREDVGERYKEIRIPVPANFEIGCGVSEHFRCYYMGLEELRRNFAEAISDSGYAHYIHTGTVVFEDYDEDTVEADAGEA